jgi:hypothetical protein
VGGFAAHAFNRPKMPRENLSGVSGHWLNAWAGDPPTLRVCQTRYGWEAYSGLRRIIAMPSIVQTVSPRWLVATQVDQTTPRSGFEFEALTSFVT